MNTKDLLRFGIVLFGAVLIVICYMIFGDTLPTDVKVLDIIVTCLIYSQAAYFIIFPLVNLQDPAKKDVGTLGLRLYVLQLLAIAAIAVMLSGRLFDMTFKYQLIAHLIILFFFLIGAYSIVVTGSKVEEVYAQEKEKSNAKMQLRYAAEEAYSVISTITGAEPQVVEQMKSISENVRYMLPPDNDHKKAVYLQLTYRIEDIRVMAREYSRHKESIAQTIEQIKVLYDRYQRMR